MDVPSAATGDSSQVHIVSVSSVSHRDPTIRDKYKWQHAAAKEERTGRRSGASTNRNKVKSSNDEILIGGVKMGRMVGTRSK